MSTLMSRRTGLPGASLDGTAEAAASGVEFANALIPEGFEFTGAVQTGVVVEYESSAGIGQLVVTELPLGKTGAIFITCPIAIKGAKFKKLLESKDVKFEAPVMDRLGELLNRTTLSLDAFYYGQDESLPMIVSVSVEFKGGLIDALVNGNPHPDEPKKPDNYDTLAADDPTKKAWDSAMTKYNAQEDEWAKKNVPVSQIFDIKGGSVRIVKCPNTPLAKAKLNNYLASLRR